MVHSINQESETAIHMNASPVLQVLGMSLEAQRMNLLDGRCRPRAMVGRDIINVKDSC